VRTCFHEDNKINPQKLLGGGVGGWVGTKQMNSMGYGGVDGGPVCFHPRLVKRILQEEEVPRIRKRSSQSAAVFQI